MGEGGLRKRKEDWGVIFEGDQGVIIREREGTKGI